MRLFSLKTLALSLTLSTLSWNPAVQAGTDEAEILALYQGWIRAVEGSDIGAYVGGLHPDISLRPPGVSGLDGRENYREFLGPVFETASYEITVDVPHSITMMGDAAVVEYDYTIRRVVDANADTALPAGALEGESTTSHYIDIVAKNDSGAWKIRLHSWSMTL
ncbi:MAG: nuclear transport factor 2 family protein [Luminiphilus sp.]|jgi:ketosteroid isomerase-like protein|nr:nuclear transport factor 2 family protein [Luminiphilus sp.]